MSVPEREFSGSPPMPLLFARAGATLIPGASQLPFIGGGGGEISELTLTLSDVAIDRDHPLTARLFGFPSAIAHGMWTKARCLAALGRQLPDAFTVEVVFRRPILLPATVEYVDARDGDQLRFGVRDAKRATSHLNGLVSF